MDILAHALWAGAGVVLLRRRVRVAPRTVAPTLGLARPAAAAADHRLLGRRPRQLRSAAGLFSRVAWAGAGHAGPGDADVASPACVGHGAVAAGIVTLLLWKLRGALWIPLLGWWSHIVIADSGHRPACGRGSRTPRRGTDHDCRTTAVPLVSSMAPSELARALGTVAA